MDEQIIVFCVLAAEKLNSVQGGADRQVQPCGMGLDAETIVTAG
jgi:hypothetical protein